MRDATRTPAIHRLSLAARWLAMLLLLALPAASAAAQAAQPTFVVTVGQKTDEHPHDGEGNPAGFAIDGVQGAELTLERGTEYWFVMDEVPSFHPFYITTSAVGLGSESYDDGVTNNAASGTDTLRFTPSDDAPDVLYYQCINHQYMGYRINITTGTATATAAGAGLPEAFTLAGNYPNPFNPRTTVRFDLPRAADVQVEVFDMLGRRRLATEPTRVDAGAGRTVPLDAASLPSGAYVYRVTARMADEVTARSGTMVVLK